MGGQSFDPSSLAGSSVVVVSPHLDDAALSLGSAIARLARAGATVRALTVFAGDPASSEPADEWGRRCGFTTRGAEAAARREEDRRACALLGARAVWVDLEPDAADPAVREALFGGLAEADAVLVPGYPCSHPDHLRVSRAVLELEVAARIGFYSDQPYAMWLVLGAGATAGRGRKGNTADLLARRRKARRLTEPSLPEALGFEGGVSWEVVPRSLRDWVRKQRAIASYRSQLRAYGPLTPLGITLYEAAAGGETVGWS